MSSNKNNNDVNNNKNNKNNNNNKKIKSPFSLTMDEIEEFSFASSVIKEKQTTPKFFYSIDEIDKEIDALIEERKRQEQEHQDRLQALVTAREEALLDLEKGEEKGLPQTTLTPHASNKKPFRLARRNNLAPLFDELMVQDVHKPTSVVTVAKLPEVVDLLSSSDDETINSILVARPVRGFKCAKRSGPRVAP
jgi:hypothetical protein